MFALKACWVGWGGVCGIQLFHAAFLIVFLTKYIRLKMNYNKDIFFEKNGEAT